MNNEYADDAQLRLEFEQLVDHAVREARGTKRVHPNFTLSKTAREVLVEKLIRRWHKTEPDLRDEMSGVILATYLVGFQYGFDAAFEAMEAFQQRQQNG
jgi:hypothetical protein